MTDAFRSGVFLAVLSLGVLFGAWGLMVPPSPELTAGQGGMIEPDEFDTERAFDLIQQIATVPHPLASAENDRVRDIVTRALTDLDLAVETQQQLVVYDHPARDETSTRVAWPSNIIARIPGRDSDLPALALMSHYDSVPQGPGAGDAASGVATIIEVARHLARSEPLLRDVYLVITDGEEMGLLGAQAFIREHSAAEKIGLILNLEARGAAGPAYMFETAASAHGWVELFADAAPLPIANSLSAAIYRLLPNDTDASIFIERNIAFLNFAFIDDFYRYHTADDRPGLLSPRSVYHEGANALALARSLADLGNWPAPQTDGNYFNASPHWLISYGSTVSWTLLIAAIGLSIVRMRRSPRLGWRSALLGAGQLIVVVLLATWLMASLTDIADHFMNRWHRFYRYHWLFAVPVLLGAAAGMIRPGGLATRWKIIIAVTLALLAMIGWPLGVLDLFGVIGALAWIALPQSEDDTPPARIGLWIVLTALVTLLLPGGSYLLALPLLAWAVVDCLESRWAPCAAILIAGWLWTPVLYAAYLGIGVFTPWLVTPLVALLIGVWRPALAAGDRASGPMIAMATAGILILVVSVVWSPFDGEHRRPEYVMYLADGDQRWWASATTEQSPWSTAILEPGEEVDLNRWFAGNQQSVPVGLAPTLAINKARVTLDLETAERLIVDIEFPDGLDRVDLSLPAAMDVSSATVDGVLVTVPDVEEYWVWTIWRPPKGRAIVALDGQFETPDIQVLSVDHNWSAAHDEALPKLPSESMAHGRYSRTTLTIQKIAFTP